MTLEEFRATRREMTARAYGDMIRDLAWEDDEDGRFLVYDNRLFIECLEDGRHLLTIENQGWITDEETSLADLEVILYEYSKDEE